MDKEQDTEWGWDVPIETEENLQPPSEMQDVDGNAEVNESQTQVQKVPSLSKMIDNKHAAMAVGNASLSSGIKSSPSFQELEVKNFQYNLLFS